MHRRNILLAVVSLSVFPMTAQGRSGDPTGDVYPPRTMTTSALRRWLATDAARAYPRPPPMVAEKTDGPVGCDAPCLQRWTVVAATPRLVSLLRQTTEKGGAHPLGWSASVVWDRADATPRSPLSFFSSGATLDAAVREAFCRQLADQRGRKRGGLASGNGAWDRCVEPVATTLLFGTGTSERFDRIAFRMDPYVAGPYAEGTDEVTLPVTPAILAAVKPAWRRYFAVAGTP